VREAELAARVLEISNQGDDIALRVIEATASTLDGERILAITYTSNGEVGKLYSNHPSQDSHMPSDTALPVTLSVGWLVVLFCSQATM
jgi:hypothetical protein